jgi:hypothetical protein
VVEKKLGEERLKCFRLKNELNKSVRIIQREVGEFGTLDEILENESWRGRAQQIAVLKSKMKDVQGLNYPGTAINEYNVSGSMPRLGASYIYPKTSIGVSAATRKREIDEIKLQNQELKSHLTKATTKLKGFTCRNKNLEQEIKTVRIESEISKQVHNEKSENDNRYINALKTELTKTKTEISRLRNKNPETLTRVIYRAKEQIEPSSLLNFSSMGLHDGEDGFARKEMLIRDTELQKKDKIIKDLIAEKNRIEEEVFQLRLMDQKRVEPRKLMSEIEALKLEKEELLRISNGGSKIGDGYETIKDLSMENGKLRLKVIQLQEKLGGK